MKNLYVLILILLVSISLTACAKVPSQEVTAPAIPDSDCVLNTLEATTADGQSLMLQIIGKANDYSVGVREIQVFSGDAYLQSIFISEAIAADGVDGIDIGYSQATSPETAAAIKDVNFDGEPDLEVTGWLPNNAIPYYYWCWDPDTCQFVYAFSLPLDHIDQDAKQLVTWYKVENGLYHTDYYKIGEHNTLTLVNQEIEDVRP